MKRLLAVLVLAMAIAMTGIAWGAVASDPLPHQSPVPARCTIQTFRPFSKAVWSLNNWERGNPPPKVIAAYQRRLACAPAGHKRAMERTWLRDRHIYRKHRHLILSRDINHVWAAHWAPDYGGPQLPFHVVAALAEAAGMPGITMAQIARGESNLRPGSAGVDVGGTVGYGLLAITAPFSDSIVAKYGGYEQMWNPVKNIAAAAEIYRSQGVGAWYGTGYVTGWDLHYRGKFHLPVVLGGRSFRQALKD